MTLYCPSALTESTEAIELLPAGPSVAIGPEPSDEVSLRQAIAVVQAPWRYQHNVGTLSLPKVDGGTLTDSIAALVIPSADTMRVPRRFTAFPAARERFDVIAQWEGVVTCIAEETFTARIADLSGKYPEE
jgi:hypothetical protein